MKIYGVVEELKQNDKGTYFAKVVGINPEGVFVVSSMSTKNSFNGSELAKDLRVSFDATKKGQVYQLTSKIRIYEDPPKDSKELAIKLGNALNISNTIKGSSESLEGLIEYAATTVLPSVEKLNSKLSGLYKGMNNYSLGARLGQCMNICAERNKDLEKALQEAEEMFKLITHKESELLKG